MMTQVTLTFCSKNNPFSSTILIKYAALKSFLYSGTLMFVKGSCFVLSDQGVAPEHVTYENIIQLVDDVRQSIENL